MRWLKAIFPVQSFPLFSLLLPFTLPFLLASLDLFFSGDHLMNLHHYFSRPGETFVYNLFFWSSFYRPFGGIVYLVLYALFGMQPFWYYLFCVILFSLNMLLLLTLLWRITNNQYLALAAAGFVALHQENYNVWYNFGAVYELLVFGCLIAAFHFYLSFLEDKEGKRSSYWLCLIFFVAALNSKEIAVVFPVILACYELIYRVPWTRFTQQFRPLVLRLTPLFLISGLYALGKMFGSETLWRTNPGYHYSLDGTMYHHLHQYFDLLLYQKVHFNDSTFAWSFGALLLLALLLRSRHMLFGLCFFLLTLLPVLPLPRVWALYLHVPLIGLSVYVAALLFEIGARFVQIKKGREWIFAAVFFCFLYWAASGTFQNHFRVRHASGEEWRGFTQQLLEKYPTISPNAVLGFEDAPTLEGFDYHLYFSVALMYGSSEIRVFRLPDREDEFVEAKVTAGESYQFKYTEGRLIEVEK